MLPENKQEPTLKPDPQSGVVESSGRDASWLPPVELLEKYNSMLPGGAERIFAQMEEHARHIRSQDDKQLTADVRDRAAERAERKRGQIFGLLIGVIAIVSGSLTAVFGAQIPGGFIGAGGVIGLVAVFVFGRRM